MQAYLQSLPSALRKILKPDASRPKKQGRMKPKRESETVKPWRPMSFNTCKTCLSERQAKRWILKGVGEAPEAVALHSLKP